jgi:3-dehydrosphinganine reductase
MKNLNGKLALVTGGSSGIGLALSKKLALAGCNLGILSRDANKLENAKKEILSVSPNTRVSIIQADVSQLTETSQAICDWMAAEGTPDLLINSAGVSRPGLFIDQEIELFRWMMDINYFGTIHTTKTVLPAMLKRESGHIVLVGSVVSFLGMYGYSAYAPTKFAIKGFADTLRTELLGSPIRLSLVFPPDTETPSLESEKPYQPPVLVAMNENSGSMTADAVAENILKGIIRDSYIITPGPDSALFFKLVGLLGGGLMYPIVDFLINDAKRKVARDQAKYTRHQVANPKQASNK